jgi:hypothetical protein
MLLPVFLLAGVLVSTCSGEPLIAIYDATGEYPQCSQGAKSYMTDCVYQSDFFSYIPSTRPVLGPDGVTCEGLNLPLLHFRRAREALHGLRFLLGRRRGRVERVSGTHATRALSLFLSILWSEDPTGARGRLE